MARLLELEDLPIRVNARGEWLHGDVRLHPRVEALFAHNVGLDEGGGYEVRLQFRRHRIEVSDTAFFVRRLDARDEGGALQGVRLWLSDGRDEDLDPATLMQAPDNVLYCQLERGGWRVPCRFTAQQYHELMLRAEPDGDAWVLQVGGRRFAPTAYRSAPCRLDGATAAGGTLEK